MRRQNSRARHVLLPAILFTLTACQAEQAEEQTMEEEPAAEEMAEEAAEPERGAATVQLMAKNESGVMGSVELTHVGDSVTVAVDAQGLSGAGEFASHIHQGTCEAPAGVVVPLNSVQGSADGSGTAVTTVDATQLEPGTSYVVMVHGQDGTPVACADLPEHGGEEGM